MSGNFDWANYVDENSNASMQSADFSELPLAKLNMKSSCDLGLQCSREGLNLELSEILNLESNSNSSRALKRSRGHSPDLSMSNVKRPKIHQQQGSEGSSEAKDAKTPQLNFAKFVKATKGSSGGETALTKKDNQNVCENEEAAMQTAQTSVCAYLDSQKGKMEASSCQTPKSDDPLVYQDRQILETMKLKKGGSMFPALQKTFGQQTNSEMISNSKCLPDILVWGPHEQSLGSKIFGVADKTKRNWNPDSGSETNAPSISSLSTTQTHAHSNESMSMATSESDMNAVSGSSSHSPTPSVTHTEPEAYTPVLFEQLNVGGSIENLHSTKVACTEPCVLSFGAASASEKGGNSPSRRKVRITNARGEVIFLSKHQIDMRLRQISIGKQTWGYQNYVRAVPKSDRDRLHPTTPNPFERISKRRFNGKVNVWRRKLHFWDAPRTVRDTTEISG